MKIEEEEVVPLGQSRLQITNVIAVLIKNGDPACCDEIVKLGTLKLCLVSDSLPRTPSDDGLTHSGTTIPAGVPH